MLLYELLVGALPFDSEELRGAGYDEVLSRAAETIGTGFEKRPLAAALLRDTVGSSCLDLGRYDRAEVHPRSAVQILNRDLGGDEDAERLETRMGEIRGETGQE